MEGCALADRACVALLRDGHVLLVRQTYRGRTFWTFPRGGVRPREDLEARVVRLVVTAAREGSAGTYRCCLGEPTGGALRLGADVDPVTQGPELHEVRWWRVEDVGDVPEVARVLAALEARGRPSRPPRAAT